MTWFGFAGVFALFFATHSIPVRPSVKAVLVRRLGARGFTVIYSLLSVAVLSALIAAASHAPYVQLWPQAVWQHYVVMAGMFGVCVLLATTLGRPNPFSFGGAHNEQFDPARPGMVRWVRHPVLAALMLWSALHLLPNGDLAHVILFGVFAGFAALGRTLIDRRKKRQMGVENWERLQSDVRRHSVAMPDATLLKRLLIAVAVYVALILIHPIVIGVPVI